MSKNNDAELRRACEDVITKRRITRKTAVTNQRGQMAIDGKAVVAVMR